MFKHLNVYSALCLQKLDVLNEVRRATVYKDLHLHISGNHVLVKNTVYTEVKRGKWKSSWESQYRPDAQLLFLIQAILISGCQDPTICHAPTVAGLQRLPWQRKSLLVFMTNVLSIPFDISGRVKSFTLKCKSNFREKTFVLGTKNRW